jgi:hypothetical protein
LGPDPLPKNLSDLLTKQENLHEKKKAIASGSQPPVAQVTSAARNQAGFFNQILFYGLKCKLYVPQDFVSRSKLS